MAIGQGQRTNLTLSVSDPHSLPSPRRRQAIHTSQFSIKDQCNKPLYRLAGEGGARPEGLGG